MAMFRKKPIVVEAVRYGPHGAPTLELCMFLEKSDREITIDENGIHIETLEGVMTAKIGDWIIRGVAGEFYPCRPDIFAQTYEPKS